MSGHICLSTFMYLKLHTLHLPLPGQGQSAAEEGQEGGPARAEDHRGAAVLLRSFLSVQHAAWTGEKEILAIIIAFVSF